MTTAHATTYRCLATIDVPQDKADLYDQLLNQAASVFQAEDWQLLVPAQNIPLATVSGPPPGLVRTLLHVWSIPSFNSLPEVMARAADNPWYVRAQALTLRETQNLYVALRWDSPIGIPDTPSAYYMMETLQMVSGVRARQGFASYMDTAVYSMNERYGWKIMLAANATTGIIDEYVNVWGMADIANLDHAIHEYRGGVGWTAAVTRVTTSLWTPRSLPTFRLPLPASQAPHPAEVPPSPKEK